MDFHLVTLVGIDNAVLKKLKKQKITNPDQFMARTRTFEEREELSKQTGISMHNLSNWTAQFDLLRFQSMSVDEASELVEAGIYSVEDLKSANVSEVISNINAKKAFRHEQVVLNEEKLKKLQDEDPLLFEELDTTGIKELLNFSGAQEAKPVATSNTYSELSEVISELGKGIADAQKNLDLSAIDVENEILKNESHYNAGLSATWYVMPEVEFTLKMDYSVTKEQTADAKYEKSDKTSPVKGLKVLPMNATCNAFFRSESVQQSTLKVRFVPVPASDKITSRKIVPDCVGKSLTMAKKLLEEAEITVYNIYDSMGNKALDVYKDVVVSGQTIPGGKVLLIGKVLNLVVDFINKKTISNCVGKTIAETRKIMEKAGISVYNIYDFVMNPALDIYEDVIIDSQSIPAGEELLVGKTLDFIAKFKSKRIVPNCVGQSVAEMKKLLNTAGISVYKVFDSDKTLIAEPNDEAIVKSQSISGGMELLVSESLDFVVEY